MEAVQRAQQREIMLRDRQAESYERSLYASRGAYMVRAQKTVTLNALRLDGARTLLDAGAGVGIHTLAAARRFPALRVLAVDFSPRSIRVLQKNARGRRLRNVRALVDDVVGFEPPEIFDRVLCSEVLQHIPSHEARRAAVKNLYRALRPGGRVVAVVYRWGGWIRPPMPKEDANRKGYGLYRYAFAPLELEDLFASVGFERPRVRAILRTPTRVQRLVPRSLAAGVETCLCRFGLSEERARYLLIEAHKRPI